MRGRRFLRPASKKTSRRAREPTNVMPYRMAEMADPSQVTSGVLNAIDHLGNQRFMLPPFADHFERWLIDLRSLLNEFETKLPQTADANLRNEITENLSDIQRILTERTTLEGVQSNESTKLQQQLARCDTDLAQLEQSYRTRRQELRKRYEKSDQRIRDEINQLDRRRIQILRKNANILWRIFRKSDDSVAETDSELDSRKARLRNSEQDLRKDLLKRQEDYATTRQKLVTEIDSLRQKIREVTETAGRDALDERREVCRRIHTAIVNAAQRTQTNADSLA
jgi:DNA repair exonuclease SbcCD ATPase subunit